MNLLREVFYSVAVTLIVSFGFGLITGGPIKGMQILAWELGLLLRFSRWALRRTLRAIGNLCRWLHTRI